jgi:hypothetical protein
VLGCPWAGGGAIFLSGVRPAFDSLL